jgi:hypothetical protein
MQTDLAGFHNRVTGTGRNGAEGNMNHSLRARLENSLREQPFCVTLKVPFGSGTIDCVGRQSGQQETLARSWRTATFQARPAVRASPTITCRQGGRKRTPLHTTIATNEAPDRFRLLTSMPRF